MTEKSLLFSRILHGEGNCLLEAIDAVVQHHRVPWELHEKAETEGGFSISEAERTFPWTGQIEEIGPFNPGSLLNLQIRFKEDPDTRFLLVAFDNQPERPHTVGLELEPNRVQSCDLVGKVGELIGGGDLRRRLSTRYKLDMLSDEAGMIMDSDTYVYEFKET